MMEVMPILVVPNLKKEELIGQLADHVRSYGSVAEVCKKAVNGFNKDLMYMILRQYDTNVTMNMRKSAMIDHFINLNMPRELLPADESCTAIVPYVAPAGARGADFPGQVVDFDKTNRKMRKTRKRMMNKWLKGARLMCRKLLSVQIKAELKRCLFPREVMMQWTVASLRDHVSSVVGSSLHGGQALIFFNKKLQQLLPKRCPKKKNKPVNRYCAVPAAKFTVIADAVQFRELMAMRRQDIRA